MSNHKYMKIKVSEIPDDVINHYNLNDLAHDDGYVYIEIRKGMPGLKQAGRIANKRLATHLVKYGYHPTPNTPALWTHKDRNISFALVMDNFGVKYVRQENSDHLVAALKDLYEITIDREGLKFLGLTIKFDYQTRRQKGPTPLPTHSPTKAACTTQVESTNVRSKNTVRQRTRQ